MTHSCRAPRATSAVLLAALGLSVATAAGCTSVSRGLGKITSNKYASAQSGTVWVVPPPQLEPPASDARTVYVSYRNISDADVDLGPLLRDAAERQGWLLVNDPQEASYRLRAQTRFYGEVEPESGGRSVAEKMGWISGAAVGATTGVLVARATDDWLAGAVAGGVVGGATGVGISNASKPREWAMITDFVLEERMPEPVEFELAASTGTSGTSGAGVGNSRMSEAGANTVKNTSETSAKRSSEYYPHGVRLSAWANQMNMSESEARPHIEDRVLKVVQQMLPQ
ncbi:MAG: complement resistance protein TraT [Planctomycetota bacterium]